MKISSLRVLGSITAVAVAFAGLAHANAPAARYTIANGTVYDTKTKLTWQQTIPPMTNAWGSAKTYCTMVGATTTLGGAGWRLPTVKELVTLVDYSQSTGPLIDLSAFPGTPASFFWSSTPVAGSSTDAWGFDFSFGTSTAAETTVSYVRCVR